jgi:HEPN domain-containing protein
MDNKRLACDWFAKAQNDLLAADNNLAAERVPYDAVCFHCQQAAEKLLKGFLIAKGREYPITHNLLAILTEILEIESSADCLYDNLALLTPYAVEVRYPDEIMILTKEAADEARQAVQKVFEWVKNNTPKLFE